MPTEPQIGSFSHKRRQILFYLLVTIFLIALPTMIFYTTGYRISFENEETSIVTTGGMYITTDNLDVDVYLDQEQIERPRLFRSAYYIQNIEVGAHRIVVQRPDLQTWVKDLPIDPHIVVEVVAFNMPLVPHVRPVTEFVTETDESVYLSASSAIDIFSKSTTTSLVYATSSVATSTFVYNEEFVFVQSLFSTTSTSSRSVFEQLTDSFERFRFATTSVLADNDVATTTEPDIVRGGIQLVERDREIFAVWQEDTDNIPFYFCITTEAASSTAQRYGQHVADSVARFSQSTTTPLVVDRDRLCRQEIKLNHLGQDIYFYDFFPSNSDLILLQLEDGLYVTEIDDRAWQNTQLLYPGTDFRVVVENSLIYILEDDQYFEVITAIEPL